MQTKSQTIGAGATLTQNEAGTFFRLLSTVAPVTVTFYRNGAEVARAEDMEAGYAEEIADGFTEYRITSATSQAVKWVTRQGGRVTYDRSVGSVQIESRATLTQSTKTVTNAAADLLPANASRRFLMVQNNHATATVYLNFSTTATAANGIKLAAGASLILDTVVPDGAISAIGDTANNGAVIVAEG